MSADLYARLEWLPLAPADFRPRCAALADRHDGPLGGAIRELAGFALDENQLVRLARTIETLRQGGANLSPLSPVKLGVISNSTTNFIVPALVGSAARHGIAVECVVGEYDQVVQSALDPNSAINLARCDAVLIAIDHRGLGFNTSAVGNAEAAAAQVDAAIGYLSNLQAALRTHGGGVCILQTLARPPETLFGSLDRLAPGTWTWLTNEFNRRLGAEVASGNLLLDVAGIAETVGLANWHDPTLWNMAKVPFSNTYAPLYADHVGRLLGALRGKSRRVLVMDLDNTLWSGVIGDDGLAGIVIAQGDATGEAHLELQAGALALRGRGIVLAVSSKNNDDVARLPFRDHPEMLIREDHIAVFQANWNDKATNISAIAEELSLGIDAMAFIDDNPFERNFVREALPTVAVPELPDNPALYQRTLAASGYFEAIAFSAEDQQRADFYQNNAKRVELQKQAGDIEAYLRSLDMEITFQPFEPVGRARIVQLINKSNQFNLTTRRYTEAEAEALEGDCAAFTLQVRLRDKLGDNGMICVIICRQDGDGWDIDTWLMSCRVLGRRVENAVLRELVANARKKGVRRLIGRYIPTDRNGMVQDHYQKLGFTLADQQADGSTVWELSTEADPAVAIPMAVVRL